MTKAEAYDKAWRPGRKDDFSLVDEIYHQNYKSIDCRTGIEANIEDDKAIVSTLGESVVFGPSVALFEGEDFVCVEGFAKRQFSINDPSYGVMMTALSYQDGKIVSQKTFPVIWILIPVMEKTGIGKITSNVRTADDTVFSADNNSLRRFCRLP